MTAPSVHLGYELGELKQTVLTMAGQAETAVSRALQALDRQDEALAARVKAEDKILDGFELQIDETSMNLLAKAPLAAELRLIMTAMRIGHELERVGDEATTIARRARQLAGMPRPQVTVEIPAMAGLVLYLLKSAIDSFVNDDPVRARSLIPEDRKVDAFNKQTYRTLADYMVRDPEMIPVSLHYIFVAKCLERIGDHATNIAEQVIYLCEALDVRHDPQVKG